MIAHSKLLRPALLAGLLVSLLLMPGLLVADDGDEERDRRLAWQFRCADGEDCPNEFFFGGGGGYLGVELTQIGPELRRHFGVPEDRGVMVGKVSEDSPAARAGLAVGDVITAIDGEAVKSSWDLGRKVRKAEEGQSVELEVYRDGRSLSLSAEVAHREGIPMIDVGEIVGQALEGVDWEQIGAHDFHFDPEVMNEAMKSVNDMLENQDWSAFTERFQGFDQEAFEQRMKELQQRMKELEKRLEERYGEKPE